MCGSMFSLHVAPTYVRQPTWLCVLFVYEGCLVHALWASCPCALHFRRMRTQRSGCIHDVMTSPRERASRLSRLLLDVDQVDHQQRCTHSTSLQPFRSFAPAATAARCLARLTLLRDRLTSHDMQGATLPLPSPCRQPRTGPGEHPGELKYSSRALCEL